MVRSLVSRWFRETIAKLTIVRKTNPPISKTVKSCFYRFGVLQDMSNTFQHTKSVGTTLHCFGDRWFLDNTLVTKPTNRVFSKPLISKMVKSCAYKFGVLQDMSNTFQHTKFVGTTLHRFGGRWFLDNTLVFGVASLADFLLAALVKSLDDGKSTLRTYVRIRTYVLLVRI